MRRASAALLALCAAALLAGCQSSETPPLPPGAAPPQRTELGWVERYPAEGPSLVFEAHSFAVTADGWTADVEVENETEASWEVVQVTRPGEGSFGVMLFTSDDPGEVEGRSREGDLPGLRPARSFEPPLPARLSPGASWRGTISAPGPLAAGLYVRLVFGPFVAVGDPPDDMGTQFSWITDNAYELRASTS